MASEVNPTWISLETNIHNERIVSVAEVSVEKSVLYLDSDAGGMFIGFVPPEGIAVVVRPEIRFETSAFARAQPLHDRVRIRYEEAVNRYGDRDDIYDPKPQFLAHLTEVIRAGGFDVIVVGNNLGAGLKKVMCIPEELRERVIIIANFIRNKEEYSALGVKRFASRMLEGEKVLHAHICALLSE